MDKMNTIKHSKFEVEILTPVIFKMTIYEGAELELEDVRQMKASSMKLAEGKKYAILLDATNSFNVTPEANKVLASKEYTEYRVAAAFVTNSLANKIAGNFFIKFNKPASPTKMFTDEATAFEWLQEIMNTYQNKKS